jgi:HK97 family phage portal protein
MRLLSNPNPRTTSAAFFTNMADDLAARGFFLGRLIFNGGMYPSEVRRIDPAHVTKIEMLRDGTLRFQGRDETGTEFVLLEDEVWYIPVPPFIDNYLGRSAILDDGREAIGAMIGLHEYANAFWGNDATPPFIFKYDKNFADQESKDNFLKAWAKYLTGRNRGKPGILEYGMSIEQLGNSQEQNQFLETRKELQLDIARLWRIPPHKIGILDRATFSNIEQQSLEFVVDTLLPWLKLIEGSVRMTLLRSDDIYFQFNVASLLRGDTKSRFESYQKARQWGWLSVNEIRAMENMNGIGDAGDRYIEPLNMTEAGSDRDEERQEQTARSLRVLHGSLPKIKTHTADAIESATEIELRNGRPSLRVV